MSFDGIFTKAIVDEISPLLIGGKINKINQPDKNEINLQIYNKENYKLVISSANNLSRINLSTKTKKNPLSAYNFCMLLRKHLIGGTIKNITQYKLDRVVLIEIENLNELKELSRKILIVELMGKHSNIILIDKESNYIIDSIKHITSAQSSIREVLPGKEYFYVKEGKENILGEFTLPSAIIENNENISMKKFFYNYYIGFSPIISYEILLNSNIDLDIKSKNLTVEQKNILDKEFVDIVNMIKNQDFSPIFIKDESNQIKDFYCINLKIYNNVEKADSFSSLVDDFFYENSIRDRINQKTSSLKKNITSKYNRLINKYSILYDELDNNKEKEKYKIYADIL